MADRPNRLRNFTDSLGHEIDRLIRQLPGADPHLRGDPAPEATSVSPSGGVRTAARQQATMPAPTRRLELAGVWLRTTAAAGLGVATIYWPYAHSCGWMLHVYLGVVGAVLVAGCWASWTAWRLRVAAAHVSALFVVFWGIVLAAEQLLPRIGYAAIEAAWRCAA